MKFLYCHIDVICKFKYKGDPFVYRERDFENDAYELSWSLKCHKRVSKTKGSL